MADAYATATDTLLKMAGGATAAADRALAAGAQRIDEAFAAGGYVTPLDDILDTLPTSVAKTRLTKQLEYANLAIAAWVLSSPVDAKQGTPSKVKKDYDEIMKWLAMVASGAISIGILGGGALAGGMSIAGDQTWDYDGPFHDFAHLSWLQH